MNIQFYYPVTCAAVVLWFFGRILLNVWQSLSVSVDFCPLFLFTDVFPWFVYANIIETVALDTPNNVTALSQMLQLKAHQWSVMSQNWQLSNFTVFWHNTIINALTWALQSVNKRKKNIQCCQLKFFQCSQHKHILFLSVSIILSTPICTKSHDDWFSHSNNIKGITIWVAILLVLLMRGIYDVHHWDGLRWNDIYIPCFMTIITGVQEILRFCLSNFKGYSVGWNGPKWHDIRTKLHDDLFRHLSNISVITATIWEAVMVLLIKYAI
jgi:hypothetical protein